MTTATATAQQLKTFKVETTANGVRLTINGQAFNMTTASAHTMAFDLDRQAAGWNAPAEVRETGH